MKYRIYLHRSRPKVLAKDITKIFKDCGINPSSKDPDVAIIIGGDGTFGYFGSKASLAELFFDKLNYGIRKIEEGNYYIENRALISVNYCGRCEDVFTDVYLERGNFGGCLRYLVSLNTKKRKHNEFRFTASAIGNA